MTLKMGPLVFLLCFILFTNTTEEQLIRSLACQGRPSASENDEAPVITTSGQAFHPQFDVEI